MGYVRIAAAVPKVQVANTEFNDINILLCIGQAEKQGACIVVTPELGITGYTCRDLFHQKSLQEAALKSLRFLYRNTQLTPIISIVGLPIMIDGKLFNVAAIINRGKILGIVPKTYIPGYKEFEEERWFASSRDLISREIQLFDQDEPVPVGTDLLFRAEENPNITFGVEICEDVWVPIPPSAYKSLAGATINFNLSASNELVGKAQYRRQMITQRSSDQVCTYAYTSCGVGESTTDVVFSGHALIAENGSLVQESKRFGRDNQIIVADVDVDHLILDRSRTTSFGEVPKDSLPNSFRYVEIQTGYQSTAIPKFAVNPLPFVPADQNKRTEVCEEIFNIQANGLAKRMEATGINRPVLGLSGGIDSTHALLVINRACQLLELPASNIHVLTMPGFGTTSRTKDNAIKLAHGLGVTLEEIDITKTCSYHLVDIGYKGNRRDVTFQNAQARYRTVCLFDKANLIGGLVVGTGDLSEIAVGWSTYGGDQLANYNVNCGVPKTLIKYVTQYASELEQFAHVRAILKDILETPVTPELEQVEDDQITQKTDDIIGPVELRDFFLYHMLRWASPPRKIFWLAKAAFGKQYAENEIKKWLKLFISRLFSQQFKRSASPDGIKVGSVAMSQRGDWRMPSDAVAKIWLQELE